MLARLLGLAGLAACNITDPSTTGDFGPLGDCICSVDHAMFEVTCDGTAEPAIFIDGSMATPHVRFATTSMVLFSPPDEAAGGFVGTLNVLAEYGEPDVVVDGKLERYQELDIIHGVTTKQHVCDPLTMDLECTDVDGFDIRDAALWCEEPI